MKILITTLLPAALAVAGCTTKSTAQANARAAYFAGQTQGMARAVAMQLPAPAPGNTVAILGPVKVAALTWTPDLTLTKTIVAAEYIPAGEPGQITLIRAGREIPVSPANLLNGDDIPMLPGDVVQLRQ